MRAKHGLWLILLVCLASGCSGRRVTPTPIITPFPFVTATPRPTSTPLPPTPTSLPTATLVPPTATPTMEATPLPTFGPSETPTPEVTATIPGISDEPCATLATWPFLMAYQSDPGLPTTLGCVASLHPDIEPEAWEVTTVYQPFEHGRMVYSSHVGWYEAQVIYVLHNDGTYQRFEDTYNPDVDPLGGFYTHVPSGLYEPLGRLGKVWREEDARLRLGFATAPESENTSLMQLFEYGEMLTIPQAGLMVAFHHGEPGTWTDYPLPSGGP